MIVYFDTSAFVPLIVKEPASVMCVELWQAADQIVATRLLFVETSAALARAQRSNRLSKRAHAEAIALRDELWSNIGIIEVDQTLMLRASEVAFEYALRGYDSVHCAAAELLADSELVAATGDRQLLTAWQALGVSTFAVGIDSP